MHYRKNVYCEYQFLEKMCEAAEENSPSKYEEKKVWRSLWNFLYNETITFNIDFSSTTEWENKCKEAKKNALRAIKTNKPEPLLPKLIRRIDDAKYEDQEHIQMKCGYHALTPESSSLSTDGLYLTMLNHEQCNQIMHRTGGFIISLDDAKYLTPLTNDNGMPIKKDESGTWDKIFKDCNIPTRCKEFSSFITIVDNYLLNIKDNIEENLKPILDNILPTETMVQPFPITIISRFRESGKEVNDLNFEGRWNIVKTILKQINRPYPIKLCIVKCGNNTFHDRTILTDNMWISCGGGFDLFVNHKASKATLINIVSPILNDRVRWAFKAYANLREEIDKLSNDNCPDYDVWVSEKDINVNGCSHFKRESIIQPNIL